jgi:hypothetical protein
MCLIAPRPNLHCQKFLATWRSSLLCKSLSGRTLSVTNCTLIIQYGRELSDDAFLHDALQSSASNVGPETVAKCVASLAQRKGEIQDSNLQRYCETILGANGEAIKTSNRTSLKLVQKLLLQSVPLAETAIRAYCIKAL